MVDKTKTTNQETRIQLQSDEWMQQVQEVARNFNQEIPAEDITVEEAEQSLRRFEQEDGE